MQLLAANNAQTVLASGINASATSITVSSGAGSLFPVPVSGTSLFKLSLTDAATESVREIVHVTAVSGDVFTVIRGQEGTSARSWSANDIAANMVTAGTLTFFAQLDSPVFAGDPKAPTAAAGDNDTTIATTAFVTTAVQGLAPINSPTFTGDPKAPTPAVADNDTSIATTAFVTRAIGNITAKLVRYFYSANTFTYTPGAGIKFVRATCLGGGGAGGGTVVTTSTQVSAAFGGNSGTWGQTNMIDTSTITQVLCNIGAGGVPNTGANGGDGSSTSFGPYLIAPGGTGGPVGPAGAAGSIASDRPVGSPCTGSNVAISVSGKPGIGPFTMSTAAGSIKSGKGADSQYGTGGGGINGNDSSNPRPGVGYGAGGGGNCVGNFAAQNLGGGAGSAGLILIEEYA